MKEQKRLLTVIIDNKTFYLTASQIAILKKEADRMQSINQ